MHSIPGLESALRALAQAHGVTLLSHPDPTAQRLLFQAQAEVAEAKALRNVRLQESRLRRHDEKDEAELKQLQRERFAREREQEWFEEQKQQQRLRDEPRQRRREQAQQRAERKQAREMAETKVQPVLLDLNGFEFSIAAEPDENGGEQNAPEPLKSFRPN